jgi:siroheme synthase-like protein
MPISVSMNNRPCLVVGGGTIALRKVENLLDYDTAITVVAPKVDDKLRYYADRGWITLEQREYRSPEAAAYGLVISATDDATLNKLVYDDAKGSGALVNVVDDPPHCDFIFPAVLRRDCLTVSVSTDGKAPFVSGHLRAILDSIFPEHWERLMKVAASFRKRVMGKWTDPEKKNACYADFLEADWKTILKEKNNAEIEETVEKMLTQPE